ncbi:hypothetical protein Q8F55_006144 [Vanrija albida]|uniref:PCI domain-containing protein n=1 Tax=Vanrija albida TaxID=181172 RepID=A0ABR3PW90_9TREE
MSSSNWPPHLKAWVQESLAKATSTNKDAVNAELKQLLLQAHNQGTVQTTDWAKVELQTLKAQANRTQIHVPPPPSHQPPPPPPGYWGYGTYGAAATTSTSPAKEKANKKNKKRKNGETPAFPSAYVFESAEEAEAKARRAARFNTGSESHKPSPTPSSASGLSAWFNPDEDTNGGGLQSRIFGAGRKKLKGKAGLGYSDATVVMEVDPNVIDWDRHTIKGTSTKLEKSYLRLTSEPSPADIRPLPVLQQTLQLLKQKWKQNHDYTYANSQFKSVRQDLTVQRIKNEFTVEVYEIHARIALEAKDLGEYNQCQSMLRQLYELGIKGHPEEFLSYRILYLLHTRNRSDMASLLGQITEKEKADPGVRHALDVHAALATSNYTKFFRLFLDAPNMGAYIMDHFVERERAQALAVMSKAYLTLPLPYLTTTLAFENDEDTDAFLASHHAAIYTNVPDPSAPQKRDPSNPWKPVAKPKPVPLADRVWSCKQAHPGCAKAIEKYRVVDLKGQVD